MNPHSLIAVLGLITAWSVSAPLLAQTGTPASASGWSRGGGMAYASAYDACAEQVDRLRLAYRAEVVFTGDPRNNGVRHRNYDASGNAITEYVYAADTLVGLFRGTEFYAVHFDHLNTPRWVKKATLPYQTVWHWPLTPFGDNLPDENPSGLGNFEFNLRFAGQYFDAETGLHYNYQRDAYDPGTGRYTQSDPIGLAGGINTYAYAGSNPLSYIDPDGTIAFLPFVAAAFAYGGAAWSGWNVGYYGTTTVQSFQSMYAIQQALLAAQEAEAKCLARNGGLPCASCQRETDLVTSQQQSLTAMGANTAGAAAYTLYGAIGGAAIRIVGILRAVR